jgi:GNAT superfamily N-acetyltransferase
MINFNFIAVGQLIAFIQSPQYLQSEVVPISPQRARSQANNPKAAPEDIALILAYDETQILRGYLGILPDELQNQEESTKIGWLSCIWVDDKSRGQGIAKKLVLAAENAYPQRLLLTEFTPEAHQLYLKLGLFADLARPDGLRCYLRADLQTILPNKKHFFHYLHPFLATFDAIANAILLPFRYFKQRQNEKQLKNIGLQYHTYLPPHIVEFIAQVKTAKHEASSINTTVFNRGERELAWIYNYPWLISAPLIDDNSQKYYFSAIEDSFLAVMVELSEKNANGDSQTIAFFMLSHKRNLLKIPYLYVLPSHERSVLAFISLYMCEGRIATFLCCQPSLLAALKTNNFGFFAQKKQKHHYMCSKELLDFVADIQLQDGDGDAVFT